MIKGIKNDVEEIKSDFIGNMDIKDLRKLYKNKFYDAHKSFYLGVGNVENVKAKYKELEKLIDLIDEKRPEAVSILIFEEKKVLHKIADKMFHDERMQAYRSASFRFAVNNCLNWITESLYHYKFTRNMEDLDETMDFVEKLKTVSDEELEHYKGLVERLDSENMSDEELEEFESLESVVTQLDNYRKVIRKIEEKGEVGCKSDSNR